MGLNGVTWRAFSDERQIKGNSLVFCPRWPLNSFWLQMNCKNNTVPSVWHFPLLGRVSLNLCRRQPVCQLIAMTTPVPASAVHPWKHHLHALPKNTPLVHVDANEQLNDSDLLPLYNTPSPPRPRLHQRDHLFQLFFCSIGHEAGRAPLLLCWGGIIGSDKHHYNVPQWVLHLYLHVVACGGARLYVPTRVFVLAISTSTPVNHAPKSFPLRPTPSRISSTSGEDTRGGRLTLSISILQITKMSFWTAWRPVLSGWMLKSSIRWVPQLSHHGRGNLIDYTDSITKNPQTSFLYCCLAKCKLQPLYNLGALICMKYESVVCGRRAVTESWQFKCSLSQSCARSESPTVSCINALGPLWICRNTQLQRKVRRVCGQGSFIYSNCWFVAHKWKFSCVHFDGKSSGASIQDLKFFYLVLNA